MHKNTNPTLLQDLETLTEAEFCHSWNEIKEASSRIRAAIIRLNQLEHTLDKNETTSLHSLNPSRGAL